MLVAFPLGQARVGEDTEHGSTAGGRVGKYRSSAI